MHEFHAVADLVHHMLEHLTEQGLKKATVVRLRRSAHFTDECIRQAFDMQSKGTGLEGARLDIEPAPATFHCSCGQKGTLKAEEALCPMALCPACEGVVEVKNAPDLEVLELA